MNAFQARETLVSLLQDHRLRMHLCIISLRDIPHTTLDGMSLMQYAASKSLPAEQLELLVAAGALGEPHLRTGEYDDTEDEEDSTYSYSASDDEAAYGFESDEEAASGDEEVARGCGMDLD